MNADERTAIAALVHLGATLGVRLPSEVSITLGESLLWTDIDQSRNMLTPGFPPLEYSYSSWYPGELRVASQLFSGVTPSQRCARTIDLVSELAQNCLLPAPILDYAGHSLGKRFGAFFGLTAGRTGITGVEAYLEARAGECRLSGLLRYLHKTAGPVMRPIFYGIATRREGVQRRDYGAITDDLETDVLCRALEATVPADASRTMMTALRRLTNHCSLLPGGTVVVTSTEDASMCSVELHAASYGADPLSLPTRITSLQNNAFSRWAAAVGGRDAIATVASIRFSKRRGLGAAIYVVPAWHVSAPRRCRFQSPARPARLSRRVPVL